MRHRASWAFGPVVLLGACQHVPPAPEAHDIEQVPPELAAPVERADAAIQALKQRLGKRLFAELGRGGPSAAVVVCRDEAKAISEAVAREQRVAVGRTSHRLRSPDNAPRPWARAHITAAGGKKAAEVKGKVYDLGDRVGVLRPIPMGDVCTQCHGPTNGMTPDLLQVLQESYPDDRATGFSGGDLRGFFWAEASK